MIINLAHGDGSGDGGGSGSGSRSGKRTIPWWLFKQAAEDGAECVFQVQRICLLIMINESKKTNKNRK